MRLLDIIYRNKKDIIEYDNYFHENFEYYDDNNLSIEESIEEISHLTKQSYNRIQELSDLIRSNKEESAIIRLYELYSKANSMLSFDKSEKDLAVNDLMTGILILIEELGAELIGTEETVYFNPLLHNGLNITEGEEVHVAQYGIKYHDRVISRAYVYQDNIFPANTRNDNVIDLKSSDCNDTESSEKGA